MNTRSIYFRLILWYSGLIVVMSLAFGGYIYQGVQKRLYHEMKQTLTHRAENIAKSILPRLHDETPAVLAAQIKEVYSPEANGRLIRILDQGHSIVYVSGEPVDGHFDPAKIPVTTRNIQTKRIEQISPDFAMFIVTFPTEVQGQSYFIEMGMPTDDIEAALKGLIVTLFFGLPVMVLIVSGGGYLLVRQSLQPVEDIRATAEKITFGNLSNRLPVPKTGDALEHLSMTLNQMLNRLEAAYEQASRFSADASHELRTPLTIIRGELESIASEQNLSEVLHDRIGSVLEETERLSQIVESLFAISRLDAGEAKIQHVQFDLAALVRSTADQMSLLAEEKNISVQIVADTHVLVEGDPSRIKQVVVNLLDNAIKYTPKDGSIIIKISAAQRKAILEVCDNGIGIPASSLPHVFERFYRADKTRSRETMGAGLGLAIVKSICLAHGGNVDIQSIEGKGTSCRVELPQDKSIETNG